MHLDSNEAKGVEPTNQAIAAANAAVPHEEPAAPGQVMEDWIVSPPATMENLLTIIVDLQNRLYAVEQELEGLRSGR